MVDFYNWRGQRRLTQVPTGDGGIAWDANVQRLGEAVRFAEGYPGADIGAKINAAIADLPATGGVIQLPAGEYLFSTTIDFADNEMVTLRGGGIPSSGSWHSMLTKLIYTGSSNAIVLGDPAGTGCRGFCLEGFHLEFPLVSEAAILVTGLTPGSNHSDGRFKDLMIAGTNVAAPGPWVGTGIHVHEDAYLYFTEFERVYIERFYRGLHIQGFCAQTSVYNCSAERCDIGLDLFDENDAFAFSIFGGSYQNCRISAVDIHLVRAMNITGAYFEGDASSATARAIRVGPTVDDLVRDLAIGSCRFTTGGGSPLALHAIQLARISGCSINDCFFQAGFDPGAGREGIENLGTAVSGVRINGGTRANIDSETGVEVIIGRDAADWMLSPPSGMNLRLGNLPTSDPSVAGAVWIDTGAARVLKSSAG